MEKYPLFLPSEPARQTPKSCRKINKVFGIDPEGGRFQILGCKTALKIQARQRVNDSLIDLIKKNTWIDGSQCPLLQGLEGIILINVLPKLLLQ